MKDKDKFIQILENQNPIKGWEKESYNIEIKDSETIVTLNDFGFAFDNETGILLGTFNFKQ